MSKGVLSSPKSQYVLDNAHTSNNSEESESLAKQVFSSLIGGYHAGFLSEISVSTEHDSMYFISGSYLTYYLQTLRVHYLHLLIFFLSSTNS